MKSVIKKIVWLLSLLLLFNGCEKKEVNTQSQNSSKELLIYCGITMVAPVSEIAKLIEQEKGVKITVLQGGSQEHYNALKFSKSGDIYIPGSFEFIEKNRKDGFFEKEVYVGYNKVVFVVQKGNPLGIKADLKELLRKDIKVVVGSEKTSSIGKETKNILSKVGIYEDVLNNAMYVTNDSRHLTEFMLDKKADLTINWLAAVIPYLDKVDILRLDEEITQKRKLYMVLLTFSKNKELANYFLDVALSKRGREIFKKYGFIDDEDF